MHLIAHALFLWLSVGLPFGYQMRHLTLLEVVNMIKNSMPRPLRRRCCLLPSAISLSHLCNFTAVNVNSTDFYTILFRRKVNNLFHFKRALTKVLRYFPSHNKKDIIITVFACKETICVQLGRSKILQPLGKPFLSCIYRVLMRPVSSVNVMKWGWKHSGVKNREEIFRQLNQTTGSNSLTTQSSIS